MDTNNAGLRIGIVSGIVSSLIVIIFINPILSFMWKVTVVGIGSLHQGYVDSIYKSAALPLSNEGTMAVAALVALGLVLGEFSALRAEKTVVRVTRAIILLTTASFLLLITWRFSILKGTDIIMASFTQRLTVLAPAISDTEYKTIQARWASMQGKADYDAIVSAMDKRAKELNVTLPPVKEP